MNLYTPKLPTYTLDDVVRAYRLLTLKEIYEPDEVRVTYDSLNNRYNVSLEGQVLYYLDANRSPGSEYLILNTIIPELDKDERENLDYRHPISVGKMVDVLFNFVDRIATSHKATSPEYRPAPALLAHFFEMFGHINSEQIQKEIADRSVRYFNMCYYLSRQDMQFDVDQLAQMQYDPKASRGDYSDIGPGDDYPTEAVETPEPAMDEEPVDPPVEIIEDPIEPEDIFTQELDETVTSTSDDDEPSGGFINRAKSHQVPALSTSEILHTVTALMRTHPIVKILSRLDGQYGTSLKPLKLFGISDNAAGLFEVESTQNPISFVELIAYEFSNTHPSSADPRLVNDFACNKLSEYLQVMFSDKLLDVHAEDYRSVYSMIEPSHWARVASVNNLIQTAMCGLGTNSSDAIYQSASNEVLDTIAKLVEVPYSDLRSTLNALPTEAFIPDTAATICIDHSLSTGMYRIIEELNTDTPNSEKKVTIVTCKDASVTFMVIEVVYVEDAEGLVEVQIGKTSRRDLTRSSDISDAILTLASVTGFKLYELYPEPTAI